VKFTLGGEQVVALAELVKKTRLRKEKINVKYNLFLRSLVGMVFWF
jgi:hypothetical protein